MALALGTRRSTVAAVASALAAIALAVTVAGRSCGVDAPGPDVAVQDMLRAAKNNDREAVFALLAPSTQQRLEAEAKRATDLVGAATRYTAKDLLSIGSSEGVASPTDITVVTEHRDHATVLVVSPAGRSEIDLVKVDGRWRIELSSYGRRTP